MNAYLKALRLPFLAGSIIPVILGAALALTINSFSILLFVICAAGIAGLHLGANLLNDYFDNRGSDPVNVHITPFSGGSRVIQDDNLSPRVVLAMALFCFAVGLGVGVWLVWWGRPLVILFGLLGLGAAWAYSTPPLQLMSRGWGEVAIFFAFGPLVTLGTYYVMTESLSWPAFFIGAPQGFFITAVIWINQFPDYEADRRTNKKNLVVRLGPALSRYLYCAIMLMGFVCVLFLIPVMGVTRLILISFIAFPLAFKAMRILWREYLLYTGIIPAQALTIQTLIAHGLLLAVGIILGGYIQGA
ncbi:MAG: prenyltransferase [Deltaproteobacteria bacterium]|nr:prenyltransferase [Deltaproteobacteria bacterium]